MMNKMFRSSPVSHTIIRFVMLALVALTGNVSNLKAGAYSRPLRMVLTCQQGKTLVIANADGSNPRVILRSSTFYLSPEWSPDGQRIIFFQRGAANQGMQLYSISPDGKNLDSMRFFDEAHYVQRMAWSADSQRLLITNFRQILELDIKGRVVQILNDRLPNLAAAQWSPDNKSIAYFLKLKSESGEDQFQLWVADSDLRNARKLSEHTGGSWGRWDHGIHWSPNGQIIAFFGATALDKLSTNINSPSSKPQIYLINGDGSNERRLTQSDAPEIGMTWSPDSRKIAFHRVLQKDNFPYSVTYVTDMDGKDIHMIATPDFRDDPWYIRWSPDGQTIAIYSRLNGYLYLIRPDGTDKRILTSGEGSRVYCREISWEPMPK